MSSHKILVTGGAGYIGSHTVRQLLREGHDVTVVDNLSKGHRHNVPAERLFEVDLADTDSLVRLIRKRKCDAVIHFAAFISVGESMRDPARYFINNVGGSLSLLDAMVQTGVKHIVFSSTAAVYGDPESSPIREDFPIHAVNPYGESKVMVETMLQWFDRIHNLTSVCLRYFNASGADPEGGLGRRARSGDAPDPAGFPRHPDRKPGDCVRRGLRYAGRHVHPRLHSRHGPGSGAYSGGGIPDGRRRERSVQRRDRYRPHCAGD